MGFLSTHFWRSELDAVDCTVEEMNTVAEGIFLLKWSHRDPEYEKGIANVTGKCVEELIVI